MALRKASSYSKKKTRPYTRKSKARVKAYIKTIPQMKVVKFSMGNQGAFLGNKHNYAVKLVAEQKVLIRDNALESCRMLINKLLDRDALGQYYFAIKVYPHHILRENKTAGGTAGADRISTGMQQSFGVTIGRAAIVQNGKEIFFISCENENIARTAKRILTHVKAKVPCKTRIVFEKIG